MAGYIPERPRHVEALAKNRAAIRGLETRKRWYEAERPELVRRALEEGESVARVAKLLGLSRNRVYALYRDVIDEVRAANPRPVAGVVFGGLTVRRAERRETKAAERRAAADREAAEWEALCREMGWGRQAGGD